MVFSLSSLLHIFYIYLSPLSHPRSATGGEARSAAQAQGQAGPGESGRGTGGSEGVGGYQDGGGDTGGCCPGEAQKLHH